MQQFEVQFDSPDELITTNQRELRHGGCLVSGPETPQMFSRVSVAFHLPDGPTVEVHGTVVNSTGSGFFVQFEKGIEYEALKSAVEFVTELSGVYEIPAVSSPSNAELEPEPVSAPEPEPEPEPDPVVTSRSALKSISRPVWELVDYASPVPLEQQISMLSVTERVLLARHATRSARKLLIRDEDGRVQLEVMRNPKVSQLEILEYIEIESVDPEALAWVGNQRRYSRLVPVARGLVRNPSTPEEIRDMLRDRLMHAGAL